MSLGDNHEAVFTATHSLAMRYIAELGTGGCQGHHEQRYRLPQSLVSPEPKKY